MGGTWAKKHGNIIVNAQTVKNLKVQQHDKDVQQKRTCMLVVYHTVYIPFLFFTPAADIPFILELRV
jgi:hypothetical protein